MTSTTTPTDLTSSWIYANNYAVIRAAWAAMDQTYGTTTPGNPLAWIDNASKGKFPPRQAPWSYDGTTWTITASISDGPLNGKFVVYKNSSTHQVMVVAMGTNGNSDISGWLANVESTGQQQFATPEIQKEVFDAINDALGQDGTQLIVAGDSKGGALAQFIVATFEHDKIGAAIDPDDPLYKDTALAKLSNNNIALIARVAPGAQWQLGAAFDTDNQFANGIQAFYSAPKMQNGSATEIISQLGGDYLDGSGNFYQNTAGVVQNQFDYTWNGSGLAATYTYLHRLGYSGFDAIFAANGSFTTLTDNGATNKGSINLAELQQLGSVLGSLGLGPQVSTAEAEIRLGTTAVAGLALSPLEAVVSLLRGAPSKVEMASAAAVMLLPGVEEALLVASGAGVIAENGVKLYSALANLWTQVFSSSASNGASGAELYTATGNANGITLTDAAGDSITSAVNGNTTTVTLDGNETLTAASTDDGTALSNVTWQEGAAGAPSAPHGSESFSVSGASTSTYYYASGGVAVTKDDGLGDVSTDYYSKAGNLIAWNFTHADGTSGSGADFDTGLTLNPGATSIFQSPSVIYQTTVNPDGSYVLQSCDPGDISNIATYGANGNQTSSTPNIPGSGTDYDRNPADTTSVTITSGPGGASSITKVYDPGSNDQEESDSWITYDNYRGTDTFTKNGAAYGTTVNPDHSSSSYSLYTSGVGASQTFDASTMVTFVVNGSYDLTKDQFNSSQQLTSDQWQLADGTTGSDTFNSDGSGSGTIQHADSETSTVTLDSSGDITILNKAADGSQESADTWYANGVYTIGIFDSDGSKQVYTYQVNGTVTQTDYASDGGVTATRTSAAGAVLDPDGTGFGKILNSDGTYSVNYYDSNGDALIFKYNGSVLIGTDHTGALKQTNDFQVTFTSGQTAQSPYNSLTPVVTVSSVQTTMFFNNAGAETGDSWVNPSNGSYGYDSMGADGSEQGTSYSSNGSYYAYTNDGQGDSTTDYFDATGTETSDAWADDAGSHGSDTFLADGSTSGVIDYADGTSEQYTNNGQGVSIDESFNAAGVEVADQWSNADGSTGSDAFDSDGSKSGYSVLAGGAYSTYSDDPTGSGLQKDYTASNVLVQEVQTLADGHGDSVAYTFDASGDALSYSLTAANGTVESGSLAGDGAGLQSSLASSTVDGDSIAAAAAGGIIVAWGDNDTVTAGAGAAVVDAWGSNDSVLGGSGDDTLTALGAGTTLIGGSGNETFEVSDTTDVVEAQSDAVSNALLSSVSYTLPTNVDTLTLQGSASLTARGNSDAANLIIGNSGNDDIIAGSGSDTLDSGSGVDTLVGGQGLDTFVVNNSSDVIQNPYGESGDTVVSSVDYVLGVDAAALTLTGSDSLTATDDYGFATITGNAGQDTLIGGSGRDTLVAGTGVDTLVGGTGDNTMIINNTADVIQLGSTVGSDTVESSVSYTLQQSLDTLVLTGAGSLVGQGNGDQSNFIIGNSGNDTLIAGSGNDTLVAGTGTDTLLAGSGDDLLEGNGGDTFEVGLGSAQIEVAQGSGTLQFGVGVAAAQLSLSLTTGDNGNAALLISDGLSSVTVDGGLQGSISDFDFADGRQLTLAQLLTSAQVLNSTLAGANGNFILDGTQGDSLTTSDGDDTIFAAGSNDTIIAGNGNQALYGLGTDDVLAASSGNDSLYGGAGADTLIAGTGYTQMQGGTGDDTFVLTQGGTAILTPGSTPGDELVYLPQGMTIADFTGYQDGDNLILQSLSGDTTAVIDGFYGAASTDKTWLIADGSGVQFLANWVGSQNQTPGSNTTYEQTITAARVAYMANLGAMLDSIGMAGGTIANPDQTTPTQNYHYTFTGVGVENLSVSDDGTLNLTSSDSDQKSYTYSESEQIITWTTPVYSTETLWGYSYSLPVNSTVSFAGDDDEGPPPPIVNFGNMTIVTDYDDAGNVTGENVTVAPVTVTEQTGVVTHHKTIPVETTYTTETQGFTVYSISPDDSNDVITAQPNFVGTVALGNGNNYVDLGGAAANGTFPGHLIVNGPSPGAFIQAGNGNDFISGTGGEDAIAAGTGFDTLVGWQGTTYYVPMTGDSTDIIDANAAYYAYGPYAQNTLVLPEGVTTQNLQIKVFSDPLRQYVPQDSQVDDLHPETLQLTYGDSTVIVPVNAGPFGIADNIEPTGIQQFQFADGTVLTLAQMLALAGPVLSPSNYNPVITQTTFEVDSGSPTAVSDLFSVSDASGAAPTVYQITANNIGPDAGFVLNGQIYGEGSQFDVAANQLSQLQFVAGFDYDAPQFSVRAFDGLNWGQVQNITLGAGVQPNETLTAMGPNEEVDGSGDGPDTLIGGFDGDYLAGGSGHDTFVYNVGGATETVDPSPDENGSEDNVLQFGPGITPASLTLSVLDPYDLQLNTGNPNDNVIIDTFEATDPYDSDAMIDQFDFADGTSLSFLQLLQAVRPSSGTVADGSNTLTYSFNAPGGVLYGVQVDDPSGNPLYSMTLGTDGVSDTKQYQYNSDGTVTYYENKSAPDGTDLWDSQVTLDTQGRVIEDDIFPADGSTIDETYVYNSDGSYQETVVTTSADGSTSTTAVNNYDANANLITNFQATGPNQTETGSSSGPDTLTGGHAGDTLVGASGQDTFVYSAGSGPETISETAPLSSNSENVIQFGNGITPDSIYVTANSSGGLVLEDGNGGDSITIEGVDLLNPVATSPIQALKFADGTITTIWQMHRDLQGPEVTGSVANADGSTTMYDFNPGGDPFYAAHKVDSAGQLLQDLVWRADLSFQADTYSYNADGSSVVTRSEGSLGETPITTEVDNYDTHGNLASDNIYTPSADGSYTDSWAKVDGSSGSYWWNASTLEYQATWDNGSSGVTSTDTYQYSSGGSPGSSGVSFTETYTDTAGDQGTRQYDASTGITSVSWYSAATGTIAGAVTDSGFIGLQNDGELANTQADPSFFNPTTSPAFQGFLAGH